MIGITMTEYIENISMYSSSEAQLAGSMEYDGLSNNAAFLAATATCDNEKLDELNSNR